HRAFRRLLQLFEWRHQKHTSPTWKPEGLFRFGGNAQKWSVKIHHLLSVGQLIQVFQHVWYTLARNRHSVGFFDHTFFHIPGLGYIPFVVLPSVDRKWWLKYFSIRHL